MIAVQTAGRSAQILIKRSLARYDLFGESSIESASQEARCNYRDRPETLDGICMGVQLTSSSVLCQMNGPVVAFLQSRHSEVHRAVGLDYTKV